MNRVLHTRRVPAAVPALVAAMLLVGCSSSSSGGDDEITVPPPATEDAAPGDGAGTDEAADRAALEQLFLDYYAAQAQFENELDADTSVYDGIAGQDEIEKELARMKRAKEDGVTASGEFVITGVTVEINGDDATLQGCVDPRQREFYDADGEALEVTITGTDARAMTAERGADGWLITTSLGAEGATITC